MSIKIDTKLVSSTPAEEDINSKTMSSNHSSPPREHSFHSLFRSQFSLAEGRNMATSLFRSQTSLSDDRSMTVACENKDKNDLSATAAAAAAAVEPCPPPLLRTNLSMNDAASRDSSAAVDPEKLSVVPAGEAGNDASELGEQSYPSNAVDIQAQLALRSEECRMLFHLPKDEVLVQDFNCALQENFLLQGHMYLFIHHICFYSNIFGFETKKTIPFDEVTCVRKAKTAAIFPNAIEVVAGERKHFFTSFFFRDDAYQLIVDGWSQHNSCSQALVDRQGEKISQKAIWGKQIFNKDILNNRTPREM